MAFLPSNNQTQIGSTQDHLEFSEVRDGIIVTKTGELRSVLLASPINFSLKSEQEQTAIVYAFQNFLNSLNFPIQIVMRSKKLDLSKYVSKLKEVAKTQTNELLRTQTDDYVEFVERLVKIANIMDKKFYVVIPFMPPTKLQDSSKSVKGLVGAPQNNVQISASDFNTWKIELNLRIEVTIGALGSIGIRSAQLNTQQVIEMLYEIYNPEEANKEKLVQYDDLVNETVESELVKPPEEEKKDEPSESTTQPAE